MADEEKKAEEGAEEAAEATAEATAEETADETAAEEGKDAETPEGAEGVEDSGIDPGEATGEETQGDQPDTTADESAFAPGANSTANETAEDIKDESTKADASELPKQTKFILDPSSASIVCDHESSFYKTGSPYLPHFTNTSKNFTPILYTFRVKFPRGQKGSSKAVAKKPSFCYMLDHVIGVLWAIYNPDNTHFSKLGPAQVHWALYFLQSVRTEHGSVSDDIKAIISAMEDMLIDMYADLSEESVIYGNSDYSNFDVLTKEKPPFSPNYEDINNRSNGGSPDTSLMAELMEKSPLMDFANISDLQGAEKEAAEATMLDALTRWREEQIETIMKELNLLKVMEEMAKTVDEDHFKGFTSDQAKDCIEKLFQKD